MSEVTRRRWLWPTLATVVLLAGGSAPQQAAVSIDNFSFTPAEITVTAGSTVVWTNRDDIPHTVTDAGAPRLFKSDALDTDERFSFRFEHSGRFAYFCSLHPHMVGTVIVE